MIQSSTQTPGRTGLTTPLGRSADYYILPPPNQSQVNVLRGGETTLSSNPVGKRLSIQKFCPSKENCCLSPTKNPNASLQRLKNHANKNPVAHPVCPQGVPSLFSNLKPPGKRKNKLQSKKKNGEAWLINFCLKQKTARDVWHLLLEFYCFQILLSSTQANCLQKFLPLAPAFPVSGKIFKMLVWGPVSNHLSLFSILFSISKKNFQTKKLFIATTTNFFSNSRHGFPRNRAASSKSPASRGFRVALLQKCIPLFKPPSSPISKVFWPLKKFYFFAIKKYGETKIFLALQYFSKTMSI